MTAEIFISIKIKIKIMKREVKDGRKYVMASRHAPESFHTKVES